MDSHHANCPHRLEKEAFKVTWECKFPFCFKFKFSACIDLMFLICFVYLAETTKFFEPKRLVSEPTKGCVPSASEFLDSWDCTTGPTFKAEKMIAGAIHMT